MPIQISIKNEMYLLDVLKAHKQFEVRKIGSRSTPYVLTLPNECSCEARKYRPSCKHLEAVTIWDQKQRYAEKVADALRDAEEAVDKADRAGTEESLALAEAAVNRLKLAQAFK